MHRANQNNLHGLQIAPVTIKERSFLACSPACLCFITYPPQLTPVQAKIEKALVKQSRSAGQHQYSQGPQKMLYILFNHLKQKRKEYSLQVNKFLTHQTNNLKNPTTWQQD